jgi:hypothetical protein
MIFAKGGPKDERAGLVDDFIARRDLLVGLGWNFTGCTAG